MGYSIIHLLQLAMVLFSLRLKHMESEVALLEEKLEAQRLEIQQTASEKQEVSARLILLCIMSLYLV